MRRVRVGVIVLVVLGVGLLARGTIVVLLLSLHAPHHVHRPTSLLQPSFAAQLDLEARTNPPRTEKELIEIALASTARQLHFGLHHPTRLSFDGVEREGNCVEYAELFASVVNRSHGSLDASAWVVRSDATIGGQRIANPAWKDHDWVLVVVRTPSEEQRFYVDPTFYDFGMSWDIANAVHGDVKTP